ncbi:glycosyltransferase [Clostridiaceae bacterium]|nr:glycosyltransferase [Clostridiaceae bacterium]
MMDEKIMLLGTLPPPIGGVTVHISRLMGELKKEGVSFSFVDLRPPKVWSYGRSFLNVLKCDETIIHYQLNNWKESLILANVMRLRRKKFISTIHSFPVEYEKLNIVSKLLIRVADWGISCFVAPSETIKKRLIDAKIKEKKIKVIHTFLPPLNEELDKEIPEEVNSFIKNKGNRKVILANASKLYLNKDREDVYGLDMCIEACKELENVKFIFVCPLIDDVKYFEQCLLKIKRYGIIERFLIYRRDVSMVCLFKAIDIFVRPTVTDSYGISVAEALYAGIPAIASDVCERAHGTILFRKKDLKDFKEKIRFSIESSCKYSIETVNYSKELYEI